MLPGNGARNSSATKTNNSARDWHFDGDWACVGFSLEEERVMQHRSNKYFPQFENQGINPVGESRSSPKYLRKHKRACTQLHKGVVNPFKIDCKVRSEGGKCNEVKV